MWDTGELLILERIPLILSLRVPPSLSQSKLLNLLVFKLNQLETIRYAQKFLEIVADLEMNLNWQTFVHKVFKVFHTLQCLIELDLLESKLVEDIIDWEVMSARL